MHRLFFLFLFSCTAKTDKTHSALGVDSLPRQSSLQNVNKPRSNEDTVAPKATAVFNYDIKPVRFKNVSVQLRSGKNFQLQIPEGYNLSVAGEGLGRLRFLARSPEGRLFATDMYDRSDNNKGRVLLFENWDEGNKKFGKISTFMSGLRNPNQVAFHKDFLYVAETHRLTRYAYKGGVIDTENPQILASFPDYGLSYKYGGWHLTRSIAFYNDKIYVSVGSSCNACIEKEEVRASIIEIGLDGNNKVIYASGLRNAVGIKWIGNELWVTNMGRDLIGPDKPEDLFMKIDRNGYYGWPFYFQYQNKMLKDPQFKDSISQVNLKVAAPGLTGFKAHSAPLGFDHFKNFNDSFLDNSVLVCLHGSTSVWRQRGNSIVKVGKGNNYTEIIKGFLSGKNEEDRHGRPCDVMMWDQDSFFFTDDLNGVLYYVWR